MLKFGNKEFRNLQEQVLKNMENIANIKEGTAILNEFGIKVVGEVDTLANLPSVNDYKAAHPNWEYGDAFAVGTEPPYELYILTRSNDTITADHWFDIGDFPAVGPQGPTGPQGEVGPQGQTGNTGPSGADAGFGSILATAQTLPAGSQATATVQASGPNTAKEFSFTFGIPKGADGSQATWGNIIGTLSDQTDLKNALDAKQDELVSGTNIKTVNGESLVGPGNVAVDVATWGSVTGTLSNQTDLKDALDAKQDVIDASHKLSASYVSGLSEVATSGSYNDLSDKPTIGSGVITLKQNGTTIDTFNVNQTSNQNLNIYTPTKTSDLTNDSGFISGIAWGNITGTLSSQTDLQDALDAKQAVIDASNKLSAAYVSGLASVATSGEYDDLLNKPVLATVATSGDYDDLLDKPTIGDASLTIQKNGALLGSFTANATSSATINIPVPTDTGDLTNNAGYLLPSDFTFSSTIYPSAAFAKAIKIGSDEYNLAVESIAWDDVTSKPTNFVTTDGNQTITGSKAFTGTIDFSNAATIYAGSQQSLGNYIDVKCPLYTTGSVKLVRSYYSGGIDDTLAFGEAVNLNAINLRYIDWRSTSPLGFSNMYILPYATSHSQPYSEHSYLLATADMIKVDDVQINGSSILSGSIANILTNTAYDASANKIATMSDIPSVPVQDVTVNGTSVLSSGTAAVIVPVQDVTVGGVSVVTSGTAAIPAIPDAVTANPTVPSGTTPTDLTGLQIGSDYYKIASTGVEVIEINSWSGTLPAADLAKIAANPEGVVIKFLDGSGNNFYLRLDKEFSSGTKWQFCSIYGQSSSNVIYEGIQINKTTGALSDHIYPSLANTMREWKLDGTSILSKTNDNAANLIQGTGINISAVNGNWQKDITFSLDAEANPTVPSGTTPTTMTGYRIGSNYYSILGQQTETWTFELADGTTVTKTVVLG